VMVRLLRHGRDVLHQVLSAAANEARRTHDPA